VSFSSIFFVALLLIDKSVLFAVGLSVYLWDIHSGVATPVVCVTVASVGFYVVSSLLPLIYKFCPYSTTTSKLIRRAFHKKKDDNAIDSSKQDAITTQALHWLIVNCEVPNSVDIALQAIAGANESLPRELLKKCNAAKLICRRLTSSSSYAGNHRHVFSLYARALSFLKPNLAVASSEHEEAQNVTQLEPAIQAMQLEIEK
jgi:hypothetical protein